MRHIQTIIKASTVITFVLVATLTTAQENLIIDKVVAKVGTENILLSDVESQYAYALEQSGGQVTPDMKCEMLQSIVGQKIIVTQAKLDSIEIPQEQIEAGLEFRIDGVLRQMNGDEAFFEEFYGMTVNEMRENLRDDLEQQMLVERMQAEVLNSVVITPKEVKEFFNSIPKDSIPFLNAAVEISEIVVKPEINDEERVAALKQVLDIRKRILEGGESFEELAKIYSDDPGSGSRGGDLGFAERGLYVQEFEAAAFSLEKDELSEPVETVHGFHIIKMIERRGNKIHVKHILVRPNITEADQVLAKERLDTIRQKILDGEYTFTEAVKKYSLEDVPSYHNNGRLQNPKTQKPLFETGDLPSDIYFAIEDMEVGDLSESLDYRLPTGETYYRLVHLDYKARPHKASLEEDYTKILQFAKESKKSAYFSSWLEEKISETFIELDRNYLSCPQLEKLVYGNQP